MVVAAVVMVVLLLLCSCCCSSCCCCWYDNVMVMVGMVEVVVGVVGCGMVDGKKGDCTEP